MTNNQVIARITIRVKSSMALTTDEQANKACDTADSIADQIETLIKSLYEKDGQYHNPTLVVEVQS